MVAIVALAGGFQLAAAFGGYWLVVSLALWLAVLLLMRRSAEKRQERQIAEQQREIAEQKSARARRQAEGAARIDELGELGIKLIDQAEAATRRIADTEAARTGWLGDPTELDFSADLAMIVANVKQVARLRKLTAELQAIPDPADDDRALLAEAKSKTRHLAAQAAEHTERLYKCAAQAQLIDVSLRDERARARVAEQSDDVRSRMHAMLYGVDITPDGSRPDTADRVLGLVAAYREIKGDVERDPQAEHSDDGGADAPAPASSSWGPLGPVNRAWHWAFG